MIKAEYALVNEDGSVIDIQMVEETKISKVQQGWPRYFKVKRTDDAVITEFHFSEGETRGVSGDQFLITRHWKERDISVVRSELKRRVDALAETERLKYITPGAGQSMVYQRKAEEAKRAIADAAPSAEEYPVLAASVGVEGADIKEVAAKVLKKEASWASIAGSIELERLDVKKKIDDAQTAAEALKTFGACSWK